METKDYLLTKNVQKDGAMPVSRRHFLNLTAGCVATGLLAVTPLARSGTRPAIQAVAFDGFTTFDPRPIFALAETLFPGRGVELSNLWRNRQFEYTWLRTVCQRYADFWKVTEDALIFAAKLLNLELSLEKRRQLMGAYLELKAYPDVLPALESLKDAGVRLAFLSNLTPNMLDAAIKGSGLAGIFEHSLSTDTVKTYKPDSRAYQMGIDAFRLKREDIVFAAFGGWDAAGAKIFGYTTFWVNRLRLPTEELDVIPDAIGGNLTDLADFVKAAR
jgi:2-haloacid dehalogenase